MIRLRHLWTTFALSRSMAFMSEPWKYLTRVCCRFSRPSNSRSGSALEHHNSDSLAQSNYSTMTLTIFQKCTQKLDVNVISQEEMSLLQVRHSIKCHRGQVFTPLKMSDVRCHEEVVMSDMPGHLCRKTTSTSTSSRSSCRKSFRKWDTDS